MTVVNDHGKNAETAQIVTDTTAINPFIFTIPAENFAGFSRVRRIGNTGVKLALVNRQGGYQGIIFGGTPAIFPLSGVAVINTGFRGDAHCAGG